jgi:hypothetical protein
MEMASPRGFEPLLPPREGALSVAWARRPCDLDPPRRQIGEQAELLENLRICEGWRAPRSRSIYPFADVNYRPRHGRGKAVCSGLSKSGQSPTDPSVREEIRHLLTSSIGGFARCPDATRQPLSLC